jgi:hypothetical protein
MKREKGNAEGSLVMVNNGVLVLFQLFGIYS